MPKIPAKEKHFFRRHYGHFKTAQGICRYNFRVCEHFLMRIKKKIIKKSQKLSEICRFEVDDFP